MSKGDACWSTTKVVLGWVIDTVMGTIELPEHRRARLLTILQSIKPGQRRVSTQTWHKVLGELRSMAIAVPGSRGLFSTLQEAFRHPEPDGNRLRLHKHVHDFLEDWRWLAASITTRPTRIAEIIANQQPHILGATDAAKAGMGGVIFADEDLPPLLWREPFPEHVQSRLVSFSNPTGTITNSDLELAGTIAQHDIIAQHCHAAEKTIHTLTDNSPAVHWQTKGSTTTTGPAAYLLRLQSLHSRHYRYLTRYSHIPGTANLMADLCSRAWHLSDSQLLTYFNLHFPQDVPWQLCRLRPRMNSALITSLYKKRSELASLLSEQPHTTITTNAGKPSVTSISSTPRSNRSKTQCLSSKSLLNDIAMDASLPAKDKSQLEQWRTPYEQWHRHMPAWGPKIHAKTPLARSISESTDN